MDPCFRRDDGTKSQNLIFDGKLVRKVNDGQVAVDCSRLMGGP